MTKLSVLVGAPTMAASISCGQVVVVEADIERAKTLKQELQEIGTIDQILIVAEVLTANYCRPVLWHRFNDARFNGPWPLEHWQDQFQNLVIQQIEERTGHCLAEVLNVWQKKMQVDIDVQETMITLEIRQGDYLATLAGCGKWLRALQSVKLHYPRFTSTQKFVEKWLSEHGFRPTKGKSLNWQRDPEFTLRFELKESRARIMQLEEQLSRQAVQLMVAELNNQRPTSEQECFQTRLNSTGVENA